jgi:hypothetical protein
MLVKIPDIFNIGNLFIKKQTGRAGDGRGAAVQIANLIRHFQYPNEVKNMRMGLYI